MKRNFIWYTLALAALCSQLAMSPTYATLLAQPSAVPAPPFALVKDINTTSQSVGSTFNSTLFGTINNAVLFSAFTPQTGSELWRTDGTAAGTQLVKDVWPGEEGAFDFRTVQSLILNNQLLFAADDGAHGRELWATDGTRQGTRLLKDLFPGADSSEPIDFVASGNRAFFSAQVSKTQHALWITDGTPGGTFMLHAFSNLEPAPALVGNTLFFSAAETGLDVELWKSDGTPAGTVLVKDIAPGQTGSFPDNLFAFSASEVWFSANADMRGQQLWRSDGTALGTQRFREAAAALPIANPSQFVALHRASQPGDADKILFNADDLHGKEVWATDGTAANTAPAKAVNPNGSASPQFLGLPARQPGAEQAFYALDDGTHGGEPWATDGTLTGTIMLADIWPGTNSSDPSQVITIGDLSFFAATSPTTGRELWKTDGTSAGTVLVADLNAGAPGSEPEDLTVFNNTLYFSADDGVHGRELWKTNGATPTLVQDILPGSDSGMFQIMGVALGTLYFAADDGITNAELWKTDGTSAGTLLVKNIAPDTGGIFFFQDFNVSAFGNKLLFGIDLASNGEALVPESTAALWRSDGTTAGTTAIKSFPSDAPFLPIASMAALGDGMLFAGNDADGVRELWRTDGTEAGTAILTNIVKPNRGFVHNLTRLNNLVIFGTFTTTLTTKNESFESLWKTDGTPQGTQPITSNLSFGNTSHAVSGNSVFFGGSPNDNSFALTLWKTDGTTAGTQQLSQTANDPEFITPGQPGEVFFVARNDSSQPQLWKSDGTPAGTVFVHNLPRDDGEQEFGELAYADGTLFFAANDGVNGWELWKSDGTDAGTSIAADIFPGAGSSHPANLIELNGVLYFTATGPDGRRTLWKSDGTSNGTLPVRDDAGAPLDPSGLTVAQGRLLFSAADDTHGREPWRSDGSAIRTTMLQDIVPGADSSDPQAFVVTGNQIYFTADTPESGRELWALAPATPDQPTPTPQPGQSPDKRVSLPLLVR